MSWQDVFHDQIDKLSLETQEMLAGLAVFVPLAAVAAIGSSVFSEPKIEIDHSLQVKSGGAYITTELVIGAADGMKELGWSNPEIEKRVDTALEVANELRSMMNEEGVSLYDAVRNEGRQQALDGKWSEDALNGYLDTIQATDGRIRIIMDGMYDDGKHISAEISAGMFFHTRGLDDEGTDRKMYEMSSAAVITDIEVKAWDILIKNEFSNNIPETDRKNYPLVSAIQVIKADPVSVSMNYVVPSNRTTVEFSDIQVSDPFAEDLSAAISLEEVSNP
jgi:hypothetical protein